MKKLRFKQVDVFTRVPFRGNPVAVVLEAEALSDDQMQAIARWTNLSETTFVLPTTEAGADYRVRIFTPVGELPFAGHPTLGTAHAVIEAGLVAPRAGALVQQCQAGLIALRWAGRDARIDLEAPAARLEAPAAATVAELEASLGRSFQGACRIVDLGPRWLTAQIASVAELRALAPDMGALARLSERLGITGLNLFARDAEGVEVRSFAPAEGVDEDPVCGSGNLAVALLLGERGLEQGYEARQGFNVGRAGQLFVEFAASGALRLGGHCITCVDGTLVAPAGA